MTTKIYKGISEVLSDTTTNFNEDIIGILPEKCLIVDRESISIKPGTAILGKRTFCLFGAWYALCKDATTAKAFDHLKEAVRMKALDLPDDAYSKTLAARRIYKDFAFLMSREDFREFREWLLQNIDHIDNLRNETESGHWNAKTLNSICVFLLNIWVRKGKIAALTNH